MSVLYDDFIADPLRTDVYLVEIESKGSSTRGGMSATIDSTTHYYSTGFYPGYLPYASVALNVEKGVVPPGTVVSSPAISGGELRISGPYGYVDRFLWYRWGGGFARVIHVGYSPMHGGWVSRADGRSLFSGEIAQVRVEPLEAVVELRSPGARMAEKMQTAAMLGSPWMLHFDGTSTQAKTAGPKPSITALTGTMTVEFRLYIESLPGSEAYLAGLYGGSAWPWAVTLTSGGALRFKSSTTTYHTTTATLSVKAWYHVAVAIGTTSTIFYITPELTGVVATETDAANNTGRPAASGTPGFAIGCAGAASYFNGYIHHVRLWSTKRTADELAETRYRRLTEGEETDDNLIGLWRGEDGGTLSGGAFDDRMADSSQIPTTQTEISAVAAGNKFTRTTGSFVTDGWVAGMRGLSSAFGDASNNGLWTVSTVSALELAVTGLTLVDESGVVAALLQSAPLEIVDSGAVQWVQALEGQNDVGGTPKPLAYGVCESVPGVSAGLAPYQVFLVAANKCNAVSAVYVGGLLYVLDTAYTDLTAFLLATTDPGKYDTLIYDGGTYVRLGSQPSFPVTVDLQGDATGSGYVSTAGQIARRIVTTRGTDPLDDPSELDTGSFTDLDTANSEAVGFYAVGDEIISDCAAFVLGSVGASGFFSDTDGKFTVNRFGGVTGTPVASFDSRSIIGIEAQSVDPPIYAVVIRYRRQYRKLSLDEIAASVLQADDPVVARLTTEYLTVRVENPAVLNLYPRAGTLTVDTGLSTETAARTEGTRVLGLYAGEASGYSLKVDSVLARLVEIGDPVYITLSEFGSNGAPLDRLMLEPDTVSAKFITLRKAPVFTSEEVPYVELVVWKGEA